MSFTWKDSAGDALETGTVNVEYTGTYLFKDNDVRAVYIDWDDGESNKKDEANYQWVELTDPLLSGTVTHTYNKTGNTFNPVVQTVDTTGIVSRYYSQEASNADVKPFSQNTVISGVKIEDTTATAIMRVENTTVMTGIDNSIFEEQGPKDIYIAVAPTITKAELNTIGQIKVEIEAIVNYNKIDSTSAANAAQLNLGTDYSQQTFSVTIDVTDGNTQENVYDVLSSIEGGVSQVVKVKYLSPKSTGTTQANPGTDYTTNEIYNRLKIFVLAKDGAGDYYPITYVTSGMPIRTVQKHGSFSTLDFSQGRAAASNVSISGASAYRYDNGKGWFSPVNQWALSTDILGTGTAQSASTRGVHYSYLSNPNGINAVAAQKLFYSGAAATWYTTGTASGNVRYDLIALDDFGRIYDQYYDVRTSVMPTSNSGSSVVENQPEVFLISPTPNWTAPATTTENPVVNYTTAMKNNGSAQGFLLTGLNSTAQKDILDNTISNAQKDYILLAFPSKTNKIFFNVTNYANALQSALSTFSSTSGLKIAGIDYLHIDGYQANNQNVYWKPLKFKDTTRIDKEYRDTSGEEYDLLYTSFAKSGYISYDMPLDWTAASIQDLCGGVYNTATATYALCAASGQADVVVTGNIAATNGYTLPEAWGCVATLTGASITANMPDLGSADDVGAFKYAFICTTGNCSGAMMWIASGGSNGWDGDAHLSLLWGCAMDGGGYNEYWLKPGPNVGDELTGIVRRINIYDCVVGGSKVFNANDVETDIDDARLHPPYSQTYRVTLRNFTNTYNLADADITGSSWATNARYLIKITLSGATGDGTVDTPAPELWNIFDATQGDSAIIKQEDDSAYSLNSLSITSGLSVSQDGNYFKTITREGKVHIVKTGISISTLGFSSVALGNEGSSTAFTDQGPSTLYGHLHTIRRLQSEAVAVYWDEPQKDGTYVRFWGLITDVVDTRGTGGPRAIVNFTFNLVVKEIALLTNVGELMTDMFPLGGLKYERDYS